MQFASRMQLLRASAIRELFDRGRRIPGAIDLSIGQVPFDVPDPIKAATIEAVEGRCGRYSPTEGYPDVVERTREHLRERFDLGPDDAVMLTVGATGGLTLALMALAGPGDEVLLPDPYFVVYRNLVHIAGAETRYYDLYPSFRLDAEVLRAAITERTRVVIVNNPANPTGQVYTADELEAAVAVCAEAGVPLLADELHGAFTYDDPHVSVKRFDRGGHTLLVGGLSKTYAMAGWRLGWAAGPPDLIDRMRVLQQFMYTCPPTLVQRGAMAAFDFDPSDIVAQHRQKRDRVVGRLRDAGYRLGTPQGTIFAYVEVPDGTDLEFCERALERKVIVVPGRAFSRRATHFRLCFAPPMDELERGLDVLCAMGPG